MSFPYEKLIRSAPPRPPSGTSTATPSSSSVRALSEAGSTTPTLAQASAKKIALVKKSKPNLPFFVRPRFRFELPDPPMDPKMLLGRLSTVSYAEPFISEIERDFRPLAVPADPSHGLRANLATGLPRRSTSHRLSIDDDALLQSVTSTRNSSDKHASDGTGLLRRSSTSGLPSSRPVQSSIVSSAPWMRRMGYDEYLTQKTVRPSSSSANRTKTPVKSEVELLSDPKFKERRRNQMLATFGGARKKPTYPDIRRGDLTPVQITPVFPDFTSLLKNFISVEFDLDETLTLESRVKDNTAAARESVQSMATISVAEPVNVDRDRDEPPKKFIACYTPTDHTLEQRKRKRNEVGDDEGEGSEGEDSKRLKKTQFLKNEVYEWFGEYSIREGKYDGGVMSRSCFAANEAVSEDGNKRVMFLTRIGTSWKLARRPVLENIQRLGKEGLEITRDFTADDIDEKDDFLRRNILQGAKVRSENGTKSDIAIS